MAEEPLVLERTGLSTEQKMAFILLLVFSVLGVVLGFVQIRNNLYGPLALNNNVPGSIKDTVNSVDALKYRDTDGDGLTDFDELYKYGTSPYLLDTFGYGMSDKEVIDKGLALCPNAGKNCSDAGTVMDVAATTTSAASAAVTSTSPTEADFYAAINNPAALRQMLLQSGVSKDVLKNVSDSDLMLLVGQMFASSTPTN